MTICLTIAHAITDLCLITTVTSQLVVVVVLVESMCPYSQVSCIVTP